MIYHLAIDIGASSGRHILGWIENGILKTEEIYRFTNQFQTENGSLVWDIAHLTEEVKTGIRKAGELGKVPETVAIDTWGVDYVLLDENRQELLPVYNYRDGRTEKAVPEVEQKISPETLYEKTGIQKQNFNTVYQLWCDKQSGKLDRAKYFLMIPEYLSFKLTGKIGNEYTNASTTGMLNAKDKTWDTELLQTLGYPEGLFGELKQPGEVLGGFSEEMKTYAGFDSKVIFAPSHDTASAVAAAPIREEGDLFLSSGTWSLLGMEIRDPVTTRSAQAANFTNEGGIEYRFRFLKNYMGMWLFQNIKRNLENGMSYDDMMHAAEESGVIRYFDVNAPELTAPENMIDAIRGVLQDPEMPIGDVLNSTYHSLARSYNTAVEEIEKITGMEAKAIHIVGGGCQDTYLNRLTARYTGKPVTAGPVEATAVGNLISQLIDSQECNDLETARELVRKSFSITEVTE